VTVPSFVLTQGHTSPLSQVRRQLRKILAIGVQSADNIFWCVAGDNLLFLETFVSFSFLPSILFGRFESNHSLNLDLSHWQLHCQLTPQGILLEETL